LAALKVAILARQKRRQLTAGRTAAELALAGEALAIVEKNNALTNTAVGTHENSSDRKMNACRLVSPGIAIRVPLFQSLQRQRGLLRFSTVSN